MAAAKLRTWTAVLTTGQMPTGEVTVQAYTRSDAVAAAYAVAMRNHPTGWHFVGNVRGGGTGEVEFVAERGLYGTFLKSTRVEGKPVDGGLYSGHRAVETVWYRIKPAAEKAA